MIEHIDHLTRIVKGPESLKAARIADERRNLARITAIVEKTREDLRERFKAVYRDPEAAEGVWRKMLGTHSREQATRILARNPAILGDIRGRTYLFGLINGKERRNAQTRSWDLVPLANQYHRAEDMAVGVSAISYRLDQAERDPVLQAFYRARDELEPKFLNDIMGRLDPCRYLRKELTTLRTGIDQAEIALLIKTYAHKIEPASVNQLQIIGLDQNQQSLLRKYARFSQTTMAEAFKTVAPAVFASWYAAKVAWEHQQRSLNRNRDRGMSIEL